MDFQPENFHIYVTFDTSKYDMINGHIRDLQIIFISKEHEYIVDDIKKPFSVTKLKCFIIPEFETWFIARRCINQEKYNMFTGSESERTQQIIDTWERNAKVAANMGTLMHLIIELLLNDIAVPVIYQDSLPNEISSFNAFDHMFLKFYGIDTYRTEWRIFADEEPVAGSIDFVGKYIANQLPHHAQFSGEDDYAYYESHDNELCHTLGLPPSTKPQGEYVIIDWKRSRVLYEYIREQPKAYQKSKINTKSGDPLGYFKTNSLSEYYIQLNIYCFILEKYYGISIGAMYIACFFNPGNQIGVPYLLFRVPRMTACMQVLMYRVTCQISPMTAKITYPEIFQHSQYMNYFK